MAASYIKETGLSITGYTELYESTWSRLMEAQDEYPLPEYSNQGMLITWRISFNKVQRQNDDAAQLLRMWGFLARDDMRYGFLVPVFVSDTPSGLNSRGRTAQKPLRFHFRKLKMKLGFANPTSARQSHRGGMKLQEWPEWLLRVSQDKQAFFNATRLLSRYSLINVQGGQEIYSIHPVLHEWMFHLSKSYDNEGAAILCGLAARLVSDQAIPDYQLDDFWPINRSLLPHAIEVCRRLDSWLYWNKTYDSKLCIEPTAMSSIGIIMYRMGHWSEAEKMCKRALDFGERTMAPEHPDILLAASVLGDVYRGQGKLAEAEKLHKQALNRHEKSLGPGHLNTLSSVRDIALIYLNRGELYEAEKMLQRVMDAYEKALGPEHLNTLLTVNRLGVCYAEQDKLVEAKRMHRRALDGLEKTVGPNHPETLFAVDNIGWIRREQGELDEAEKMHHRAINGFKEIVGSDHRFTLLSTLYLGYVYAEQGKLADAECIFKMILDRKEKGLGSSNSLVLKASRQLGLVYELQDKLEEAERMLKRSLDGHLETYGSEHRWNIHAASDLRRIQENLEESNEASTQASAATEEDEERSAEQQRESSSGSTNVHPDEA